jgi:hypothetical protein
MTDPSLAERPRDRRRRWAFAQLGLTAAALYGAPVVLGLRGLGAHHKPGHDGGPPGGGGGGGGGGGNPGVGNSECPNENSNKPACRD